MVFECLSPAMKYDRRVFNLVSQSSIPIAMNDIQRALEGNSRMPKKAADKKFQMQNNLAPMSHCFISDSNRLKQR